MQVVKHSDVEPVSPYPGVVRKLTVHKGNGAGGITAGVVHIAPGGMIKPHTHLVEEAMTLIEGRVLGLVGTETTVIEAGSSWLAPANTVHGAKNIGETQATLVIAYPSVEVGATLVDVEF
ncbi:MAG: cupin domain-containing protein [Chloroflexota bacterium]